MAGEEGGNKKWILLVIIIIIILLIFLWPTTLFAGIREGGYVETRFATTFGPIFSGIRQSFSYMGSQLSRTGRILRGEETFTLESEVEERQKSGIEITGFKTFGLEFGSLEDEFGFSSEVVAWQFDEEIEYIDAVASCSLDPDKIYGEVRSDYGEDIGGGRLKFRIFNPTVLENVVIPLDCVFSRQDVSLPQNINLKTANFKLSYLFSPETYLDVFVLPEDVFKDYSGRFDLAFRELEGGKYRDYRPKVVSTMRYVTDVEAKLGFSNQPLGVNKYYSLGFQFKNKNVRNEVDFKDFTIKLPVGMKFDRCKYLERISDREARISRMYIPLINQQLNSEMGETQGLKCKIFVEENVLGGSKGEIVKVPPITGKVEYVYILKEEKSIEVKKGEFETREFY